MHKLTPAELSVILHIALEELRSSIDLDITAPRILVLTSVHQNPQVAQADLGIRDGEDGIIKSISSSAISRNVIELGQVKNDRTLGPNLLTQRPDITFRRRNVLEMTPSGEKLFEIITNAVNKKLARLK